ncbi:MAG: CRISPR system precrRNA processing endoribonuclease RAMP protein Cas6 [Eubacterium sp.]
MLEQINFRIQKNTWLKQNFPLSVVVNGYLNRQLPEELSKKFHDGKTHRPYSMYFKYTMKEYDYLTVNTLNDEGGEIIRLLRKVKEIPVTNQSEGIVISGIESEKKITFENLRRLPMTDTFTLRFCSPTTYRKNNAFCCWFDLGRLIQMPIHKMKEFEDYFEASLFQKNNYLNEKIKIKSYNLRSWNYKIHESCINGLIGDIAIKVDLIKEELAELNLILRYAEFCGMGAKNSLGMGGMKIE